MDMSQELIKTLEDKLKKFFWKKNQIYIYFLKKQKIHMWRREIELSISNNRSPRKRKYKWRCGNI